MQKGANLAELEKCCVMGICSYGSASREPRTSPPKIWPNNNLKNFGKFSRNLNAYSRMDLKCVDSVARRAARDTFSLSHFQFRFFPQRMHVNLIDLVKSFLTDPYSNEYLVAKIGFDTAENEHSKFAKVIQLS